MTETLYCPECGEDVEELTNDQCPDCAEDELRRGELWQRLSLQERDDIIRSASQ